MKLTANLAKSQLKTNRRRTFWTLLGIIFSCALITAVFGVAASCLAWVRRVAYGIEPLHYDSIVMGIGIVVNLLVVGISVVVISNSFRVSAGERMGQFGILKSVGATKKQITQTVVYEAVFLLIIGIPLGILLGILFQWGGIFLANDILGDMQEAFRRDISIPFVISWWAVLISVVLSSLTVLYSAWRPARKAAKMSAIDAIRGSGEVKIKERKVCTNPIVKLLFGFEGMLASKQLKRSRRNFRATVVSLASSMVLFIGAGAFGAQMQTLADNDWMRGSSANVVIQNWSSRIDRELSNEEARWGSLTFEQSLELTEHFKQHGEVIMLVEAGTSVFVRVSPDERAPDANPLFDENFEEIETRDRPGFSLLSIVALDDETYAHVSELAGVPIGSNILVNLEQQWSGVRNRRIETEPWVFSGQTWELLRNVNMEADTQSIGNIELHGVLGGDETPPEIISRLFVSAIIVPPDSEFFAQIGIGTEPGGIGNWHTWFVAAENASEFEYLAYRLIEPFQDGEHGGFGVGNLQAQRDMQEAVVRVIMTATYLFIAMLTLIGLTNVISTISTNVRTRAKEFATLESVGMARKGIARMLRLESLLCSLRAICFGIPLGLGLSYVMYLIVSGDRGWRFDVPWLVILQSTLAVFVLTWAVMQIASRKTRDGSIVEAIRGEGGM